MKKLTLNLETLHVETFATGGEPPARGTVQAHYGTNHTNDLTCKFTCAADCTEFSCGGPEPTVCW